MRNFTTIALVALGLGVSGLAVPAFAEQDTGMLATMPQDGVTVSNYYKQNVYDPKDNKIGDVNDVLLTKDGRVSAVIIGVGGFLGVGEKDVAVPFGALAVREKNGDTYLVLNTTKEALQSAPGYSWDRTKGQWVPATKQG